MRIEIDIPDWCDERHIRVFAGIEEVARRLTGKQHWEIKVSRCTQCGECCKRALEGWAKGMKMVDGVRWCEHLIYYANEYRCDYLIDRPFSCSCGDSAGQEHCNIRWEKVE